MYNLLGEYMFDLDNEQKEKLAIWKEKLNKKIIEKQRETMSAEDFALLTDNGKYPYSGATGGSITYSFTPTSLGIVTIVTDGLTGESIDLTDYDSW